MLLYAVTIFVSAFLLFLVQPIIAKQILPWFGGSAAVWTTCLVFFQSALLAGYAYADCDRAPARAAARRCSCTSCCSCVSLASLPIIPARAGSPSGGENPIWLILGMLVGHDRPALLPAVDDEPAGAGLVRATLSGTQSVSPVRAVESGVAAGAARLSVPARAVGRRPACRRGAGRRATRCSSAAVRRRVATACSAHRCARPAHRASGRRRTQSTPARAPTCARQLLWCALAATGSLLLLAVTNHITQNIASVPLLWIVPLSLYLLTFILCFDGTGWYARDIFLAMLAAALGVMAWTLADAEHHARTRRSSSACSASGCSWPACSATASWCGSSPRRAT